MKVIVLASGSSGNAALVEANGTRILLDAGVSPTAITKRLRALGMDLFPRGLDAIVVSHQHGDHMSQIEPLLKAVGCPAYFHRGIEARRVRDRYDVRELDLNREVKIGGLTLEAHQVPHDAPQVALRVSSTQHAFGIATDLGSAPDDVADFLGACDTALVEANHCPALLHVGPYPQRLKRRVGSDRGHLNNHQTADLARRMLGRRLSRLLLGHLSRVNNEPDVALSTVRAAVGLHLEVTVVPHGQPHAVDLTTPVPGRAMTQMRLW